MGFALTVLYLLTYYLTPATLFGPLAAYRIELILAILAILASLPALPQSLIFKTPQSLATIGLAAAVFLSILIGMRWFGGVQIALFDFLPCALAYFLVCLHCGSKLKLRILVGLMVFVCFFVILQGTAELKKVADASPAEYSDAELQELSSHYVFAMKDDQDQWFYRLGGLGQINDPNDFAQLVVCVVPLVFMFWGKRKPIRNVLFVLLPVGGLLFGVYLTHSRGAILAVLAIVIVAARRRIGLIPSIIIAAGLFFAATALNFSGGREISATSGEDRTALWGTGLQLLKTHPLFGVGFDNMPDYAGQTAHNSVVVCAAELGLFGLFFWVLFVFSTVNDAFRVSSAIPKVIEAPTYRAMKPAVPNNSPAGAMSEIDIHRFGTAMLLSLTGFLVAGWFLSRAFVLTLFLLGGMAEILYQKALERDMVPPRMRFGQLTRYTGLFGFLLILVMYISLRILNLMH